MLRTWLAETASPDDPVVVLGDFNVAPEDRDVWSLKAFEGVTHVTEPERAAVAALCDWGLVDAFRRLYDQDRLFTYWDYRRGRLPQAPRHAHRPRPRDEAARGPGCAGRSSTETPARAAAASDHAPLVVDLDD